MLKKNILSGTVVLLLFLNACKTANSSDAQALPLDKVNEMSQMQWTEACESELNHPKTGALSRAELKQLANTEDCAAAFPLVKNIVAAFARP